MAEVLFYHLSASPLERTLPDMLERALVRGWRVLVRCGSEGGLGAVDTFLWSYRDDAFLPHGTAEVGHSGDQPIYLTLGRENPNGASILILVDGAKSDPAEMQGFDRACVIFDGNDEGMREAARADWRAVTGARLPAKYWAQEGGHWVQKAAS